MTKVTVMVRTIVLVTITVTVTVTVIVIVIVLVLVLVIVIVIVIVIIILITKVIVRVTTLITWSCRRPDNNDRMRTAKRTKMKAIICTIKMRLSKSLQDPQGSAGLQEGVSNF